MNDKLQGVLTELASKFGTSVEHLWKVLVYQARIEVITDLVYYLLVMILGIILFKFHLKFDRQHADKSVSYERTTSAYEDSDVIPMIMFVFLIGWVILLIISFCCIGGTISAALNPEYWALRQIINK